MVRQIHDVKGIDMGNGVIRWETLLKLTDFSDFV